MDLLAFALYHEGDARFGAAAVVPPTVEEEEEEGTEGEGPSSDDDDGDAPAGAGGKKRRKSQQQRQRGPEEEDEFGEEEVGSTRGRGAHDPAVADEEGAVEPAKRARRQGGASDKGAEARSDLFVGRLSRALAAHADGVGLDAFLETVRRLLLLSVCVYIDAWAVYA